MYKLQHPVDMIPLTIYIQISLTRTNYNCRGFSSTLGHPLHKIREIWWTTANFQNNGG